MVIFLSIWLVLGFAAALCGLNLNLSMAVTTWAGLTASLCAGGAFLISRQPLGVATLGGRIGSSVVHWGFRAGRGLLLPAAVISWLIWLVLGGALMAALRTPEHAAIIAAWTGDLLGLFYVVGVMLTNRGGGRWPAALLKVALAIAALISASAFLWFRAGTDEARAMAFFVAGGPPLFIGAGYGVMLAVSMIGARGRSVR